VIKMHHMIVDELRGDHEIADQLRVGGDRVLQGVFDRPHRGDAVDQRTHAAYALCKSPRIARVAPLENDFDAAHHGAGARRLRDDRTVELRLDPQMSFDPSDGIDHDGLGTHVALAVSARLAATSSSRLCGVLSQVKCACASSNVRRQSEQLVRKVTAPVSSTSRSFVSRVR
jgi:hypothetical protein